MAATSDLRHEHVRILKHASLLSGLAGSHMTNDTAAQSRRVIMAIDAFLVDHLMHEDGWLYPTLAECEDQSVRQLALDCAEEMGGILGAWIAYREQWDQETILNNPQRFDAVTRGIIGALAMRVERENEQLYPLMDRLMRDGEPRERAA